MSRPDRNLCARPRPADSRRRQGQNITTGREHDRLDASRPQSNTCAIHAFCRTRSLRWAPGIEEAVMVAPTRTTAERSGGAPARVTSALVTELRTILHRRGARPARSLVAV